jgi:hypothetical protein
MEYYNNAKIEIKLLPNRRFIYSNRRQNIVISAENKATEITVLFPDEYESYSKRVDFVNSQGKAWTEGLYIPEYTEYPPTFDKSRISFMLPNEVTTAGELKMQFLAYMPDNSLTAVPFEIIPIQVDDGIMCFKRNGKHNPDLLILSYNQSTEALFVAQQAKAKSAQADTQSLQAIATADAAKATAADALDAANQIADNALAVATEAKEISASADVKSDGAAEKAALAEEYAGEALSIANTATGKSDTAVAISNQAKQLAGNAVTTSETAERNSEEAVATAIQSENKADGASMTAGSAKAISEAANAKSENAVYVAEEARSQIQAADARANQAVNVANGAVQTADAARQLSEHADHNSEFAIATAQNAVTVAEVAEQHSNQAMTDGAIAKQAATQALAYSDNAMQQAEQALNTANLVNGKANTAMSQSQEARDLAFIAEEKAAAAVSVSDTASTVANDAYTVATGIAAKADHAIATANKASSAVSAEIIRARAAESEERERATAAEGTVDARIAAEEDRATAAEDSLSGRLDFEIPAAIAESEAYTDQTIEQMRIDGTIYKGTRKESELPTEGQTNGDLYWIGDFDISTPTHSGSAIWNGATNAWDFSVDKYRHEDGATIVPRDSDGALKISDTLEESLVADGNDFGASVNLGFKATIRTLLQKIKGLFAGLAEKVPSLRKVNGKALSADITLNPSDIGAEPAFTKNSAFNKEFGNGAGTVCEGSDTRLSNARAANGGNADTVDGKHASDFATTAQGAKADAAVPNTRKVNNKALAVDITLTPTDVGAESAFTKNTAFNKNFGSAAGTVCEGNDTRLSNARAANGGDADTIDGKHASDLATAAQGTKADTALQSVPDATASVKGLSTLGAIGGAARYGQKTDAGLGSVDNERQYSASNKPSASNVTVTANANLGNYTNLQDVLNYIGNVFAGAQAVTKIKAGTLDTTT